MVAQKPIGGHDAHIVYSGVVHQNLRRLSPSVPSPCPNPRVLAECRFHQHACHPGHDQTGNKDYQYVIQVKKHGNTPSSEFGSLPKRQRCDSTPEVQVSCQFVCLARRVENVAWDQRRLYRRRFALACLTAGPAGRASSIPLDGFPRAGRSPRG